MRRIASLHRELAAAYDDMALEQEEGSRARARRLVAPKPETTADQAQVDAVRRRLRKQGVVA